MRISDWSSDVCSSDLIAITGQQDQPFGLLVEAADREDALLMADEIDDVALDLGVGGAGNASGLVQGDIDMAPATGNPARPQWLSVQQHRVAIGDGAADTGNLAVDADSEIGRANV